MTLKLPFPNDSLTYGAEWLRYLAEVSGVQEGVVGAADMKVTAAAAGGMRVDIAAGTALVRGDSGTPGTGVSQGLFLAVNDASIPNAVTLPASNGTNPRIDQIAVRVRDKSDLGTGFDDLTFVFLSGTATAGATLDNRNGAVALPADHLRIADVLVPAGSSAVTAGNVRDRRPWARGAFSARVGSGAGNHATISASLVTPDPGAYGTRVECSGAPVVVGLDADCWGNGVSLGVVTAPLVDGADTIGRRYQLVAAVNYPQYAGFSFTVQPSPGSHVFDWAFCVAGAGTGTIPNDAPSRRPRFTVREEIRASAPAGSTTAGTSNG